MEFVEIFIPIKSVKPQTVFKIQYICGHTKPKVLQATGNFFTQ